MVRKVPLLPFFGGQVRDDILAKVHSTAFRCTTLFSMPVSVFRLRRWFAAATIFVCVVVAGTYFYAWHRVQNALKQVPEKIGLNIQQSAAGFTVSKSEQGRTLFKLQAGKDTHS